MPIKYPVRVEGNARENATFVHIRDASDRAIAGGLSREDAEEIVSALNARHEVDRGALCEECEEWEYNEDGSVRTFMVCGACWNNQVTSQPRKKSKRVQIEEHLKRSDLSAQIVERDDIEYGHHESLPRGEHVARLKGGMKQRT